MKPQLVVVRSPLIALVLFAGAATAGLAQSTDTVSLARQLARAGKRGEAEGLLARRLASNPRDLDALVVLIYVELWSGHASHAEQLAADELKSNSGSVDLLVAHATTLRRLNRRPEALAEIERAAGLAPDRRDVVDLRRELRHEVRGSELTLTENSDRWDNGEMRDETQVDLRHNTGLGSAIARYSRVTRFGVRDDKIELEAYPQLRTGYGYLAVGSAPSARIYPHSTVAGEFFATLPSNFEGSLGYRRLNFGDAVNVFTGSAGRYENDALVTARLNQATGGARGTSVLLSARRYFSDAAQYVGFHLSGGSIREDIQTSADVVETSSAAVGAESLLLLRTRWILVLRAEAGRDDARTTGQRWRGSGSVGFGVRF